MSEISFIKKKKKRKKREEKSGTNYLRGSVTEEKLFKAPCASTPGLPRSTAKSRAKLLNPADDTHNINVTLSKITSSGMIAQRGATSSSCKCQGRLAGIAAEAGSALGATDPSYPSVSSVTESPTLTIQNDHEFVQAQ